MHFNVAPFDVAGDWQTTNDEWWMKKKSDQKYFTEDGHLIWLIACLHAIKLQFFHFRILAAAKWAGERSISFNWFVKNNWNEYEWIL